MKKTILKSLLLGFTATVALNASAVNRVYFSETEVTPGEEFYVDLILENTDPDQPTGSWQAYIHVLDGLTFRGAYAPKDIERSLTFYNEEDEEYEVQGISNSTDGDLYKIVAVNMKGHELRQGVGVIARFKFKAASNFAGGKLVISEFKGSDFGANENQKSYVLTELEAPYDLHVASQVDAMEATTLADVVANGVDGKLYKIADDLHVALVNDGKEYAFVSDGKGNWMNVITATEEDLYYEYSEMEDIQKGTLVGYLLYANGNQALTVTRIPKEGTTPVNAEIEDWNLAQSDVTNPQWHFRPKVNQVINLTGYYSADDAALYAYYNKEGQYASLNTEWLKAAEKRRLKDATLCNLKNCVALIKAPWDAEEAAPAPAKVRADDVHAYENYVIYPTAVAASDVVTGVDNLNAGKNVASVQYVNVAGMVSDTPFDGVNMVITRYADGTQVTSKVIK